MFFVGVKLRLSTLESNVNVDAGESICTKIGDVMGG